MSSDQVYPTGDLDYGLPLGAGQGVVAYSNLDDYYFSGVRLFHEGIYCGYKYQCVEYARRYMLLTEGCIFPQCSHAHEIFDQTEVQDVQQLKQLPFIACANGTTTVKPAVGMTLVYPRCKKMPVGHVAVITAVWEEDSKWFVGIGEQNQASLSWQGKPYGRKEPLEEDAGTGAWRIVETDPALTDSRGWLYVEGSIKRNPQEDYTSSRLSDASLVISKGSLYAPLQIHAEFEVPSTAIEYKLARFSTPVAPPGVRVAAPGAFSASDTAQSTTSLAQKIADQQQKRSELLREYLDVLQKNFNKFIKEENGDYYQPSRDFIAPVVTYKAEKKTLDRGDSLRVPFSRGSAPCPPHYVASYAGGEKFCFNTLHWGMVALQLIEWSAAYFFSNVLNEENLQHFSDQFDCPSPALLKAIQQQVLFRGKKGTQDRGSSYLDFGMGTVGLAYDFGEKHFKVAHSELDTVQGVMDITALQESYMKDTANIRPASGWVPRSFGNDFHRMVKNFQRNRKGITDADKPVVFVDFGPPEDFGKYGFSDLPESVVHGYRVERLNALYLYEYLIEFLHEKQVDVDNGDLMPVDAPHWTVVKRNFWEECCCSDGSLHFTGETDAAAFVWKMAPWSSLFALHYAHDGVTNVDKDSHLHDFIYKVAARSDSEGSVFQPLWTHVVGHPRFLPLLSEYAAIFDDVSSGTNKDKFPPSEQLAFSLRDMKIAKSESGRPPHSAVNIVIPKESWSADSASDLHRLPKTTYSVDKFQGLVDPKYEREENTEAHTAQVVDEKEPAVALLQAPHGDPASCFVVQHLLMVGGIRGSYTALEGTVGKNGEASIYDAYQRVSGCFMREFF